MLNPSAYALGANRSCIRDLFEYGCQRAAVVGRENVYDYSLGNPSIPSPKEVDETVRQILDDTDSLLIHGYTSAVGDYATRKAISDDLNARYDVSTVPEEFFIGCGAAPELVSVFRALAVPGEEILAVAPYFPEYKPFAQEAGLEFKVVPADIPSFQINLTAMEQMITPSTQAIILNSPNNPSGVVYSRQTLETLAAILRAKEALYGHPIYLISDEPYREIAFHGVEVPWVPQVYKDTIVCYSYSKSLSLPGERLGYVLVPKQVTDAEAVYAATAGAGRSLGYVNAPSLFQQVVSRCCDLTSDIGVYERNCALLTDALREMGYHVAQPGGAFYLFPRSLEPDDMAFSERAKQFDLLLVPGSGFGAPGHFRIAYCVQTEMIERALPRFKALAESYRK